MCSSFLAKNLSGLNFSGSVKCFEYRCVVNWLTRINVFAGILYPHMVVSFSLNLDNKAAGGYNLNISSRIIFTYLIIH